MKKYLITGAAGVIGVKLIDYLIELENCEITAFDLKSPSAKKRLDKYKNKINIVYGDINDNVIVKALVKDHDVIYHLAGVLPPSAEINENLTTIVDYNGSKIIIDAIKEINPKAYFIFPSTTTMYGNVKNVDKKSDINIYNDDYYSQNKYKVEKYIEKNLINYTIYRLPLVLSDEGFNNFMYNIPLNSQIEVVSDTLVAEAFSKSIKFKSKLNKKTFILTGGEKYRTNTNKLLTTVLNIHGISFRYIMMKFFLPANFYTHYYEDKSLNDILDYQHGSIKDIYKSYSNKKSFFRCINRLLAYINIRSLSKK